MKTLIINSNQLVQAEKIIKKEKRITTEEGNEETLVDIFGFNNNKMEWAFYNFNKNIKYKLQAGQEWDIDDKVAESNYLLDLDFRLSMLELGV